MPRAPLTAGVIPGSLAGEYPPYFLYGPLVSTMPSADRLASMGPNPAQLLLFARTGSPLLTRLMGRPAFPGQQLVMVSSPLQSHKLARGYGNPMLRVLDSVNGTPVKNLAHLVEMLRDGSGEFVAFHFVGEGQNLLVLPRADVAEATEAILADNGIRAQASPELLKVWSGGR